MKKLALYLSLFVTLLSVSTVSKAQCNFVINGVNINSINTTATTCVVNLDAIIAIDRNNGNKRVYLHLWEAAKIPPAFDCPPVGSLRVPGDADLSGAFDDLGTLVIDPQTGTGVLVNGYDCSTQENILFAGIGFTRISGPTATVDTFSVTNITLTLSSPCSANVLASIKGFSWSTQSGNLCNINGGCANTCLAVNLNDPTLTASLNCGTDQIPNTFNVNISTFRTPAFNVIYTVYRDDNNDGVAQAAELVYTSPSQPLVSGTPINNPNIPYVNTTLAQKNANLIVRLDAAAPIATPSPIPTPLIDVIVNGCQILPVKLANFDGVNQGKNNLLNWSSISEINVKGFDIERSADGKNYSIINSVQSKANGGNSSQKLDYSFVDTKPFATSLYRLRLVDKNGNYEYSKIVTIKSSTTPRLTVFPNPNKGTFTLSGVKAIELRAGLRIYNSTGQQVGFSISSTDEIVGTATITLRGATKGIYFIEVNTSNGKQMERLYVD